MSAISFENLMDVMKAATEEERKEFFALAPKAVKAKAKAAPKAKKDAPSLPSAEDGDAPAAEEYRVSEADIDNSTCVGRIIKDGEDKRWSPVVYRERQCGKKVAEDSDLCTVCKKREERYAEASGAEAQRKGWTGRVTEDPLDWVHMLGTVWAEEKKPKFSASASSAASVAEDDAASEASEEAAPAPAPAPKEVKEVKEAKAEAKAEAKKEVKADKKEASEKADKASEKAKKDAEKAAKKEADAAEKAKKDAEKAKKDAEKAAKKEADAAEKVKKDAEKAAKKEKEAAEKAAKPKKEVKAKVAAETKPVEVMHELVIIGDTSYMTKNGNVYEWNKTTEVVGDYVGRLTGDEEDPSIDTDGLEVTA